MNKKLGKKVYESKLVVNCETYEELIKYLDFLSRKGCKSVLGPIDEIKETTILDLWNKLFKSICVRIDKGIIKYIHFNNIRFYKNLMGEDSVITYKELMQEEINVENAVFKDLQEVETQGKQVSNALKKVNSKLKMSFDKFNNSMDETKKMIESDEYKEFIDKIKKESEHDPFTANTITIRPNIKFLDLEPQFGTSGNLDTQNCRCYAEGSYKLFKNEEERKEYIDSKISRVNNYEKHKYICNLLNSIYVSKNHDYGNSFSETFLNLGIISAVTRITDKVNRLQSLCKNEQKVNDESVKDTLMDCANYCIMTIMELDK